MTLSHIAIIGGQVVTIVGRNDNHTIIRTATGRTAKWYPEKSTIVFRHSVTGRFVRKNI